MTKYEDMPLRNIDLDELSEHAEYHNICEFTEALGTVGHTQIIGDLILRAQNVTDLEKQISLRLLADIQYITKDVRYRNGHSCKLED